MRKRQRQLAESLRIKNLCALMRDPSTPADTWWEISHDASWRVISTARKSELCPPDVLRYLIRLPKFARRMQKALEAQLLSEQQSGLRANNMLQLHMMMASRPRCDCNLLRYLAVDPDPVVRLAVVNNESTPINVLHMLKCDQQPDVSKAAAAVLASRLDC